MIKHLGIITFCTSLSCLGAYLSHSIRLSGIIRSELIDLIHHIYGKIKYEKTALSAIFSSFSSNELEKCGFLSGLRQGRDIYSLVDESLSILKKGERKKIKEFFKNLGKSHLCEKEMILCSSFMDYLKEIQQKSQKEDEIKSGLYKKLGIIASLFCAIIFI